MSEVGGGPEVAEVASPGSWGTNEKGTLKEYALVLHNVAKLLFSITLQYDARQPNLMAEILAQTLQQGNSAQNVPFLLLAADFALDGEGATIAQFQ